ncbi:MAG: efflux RND transporter permease subunit [bacterium]
MNWISRLYTNHVLANLVFVMVLVVGTLSFLQLPREQDPTINFNWIDIATVVPGMSAEDVETQITDVLEDGVRNVADINFIASDSHESLSHILIRFNDIDSYMFDKRVNDLRRELQAKEDDLPEEAVSPYIFEVTTANAFPTASVVISAAANDENLRKQSERVKKDLEQIKGVDRILDAGIPDPELRIEFSPEKLEALGIPPLALSNTVALHYRDLSAGSAELEGQSWLVRVKGTSPSTAYLSDIQIEGIPSHTTLGDAGQVIRSHEEARHLVMKDGQPSSMLSITKKASANTLKLVERVNAYVDEQNLLADKLGVTLEVVDDQTGITRNALHIMETNAVVGLVLVLLITWLFLGFRIALLTSIGIPFILAGTFWVLQSLGQTLNVTVLLGVVISLGMLVDDAVVIVESIFYRLQRGMDGLQAATEALKEVFAPVTAAVLTTMAAFLPLMLLPGIIGSFMKVVPMVVTIALALSLVEAYWMLPAHVVAAKINMTKPSKSQRWRARWLHALRIKYTRLLVKAMRVPRLLISSILLLFVLALVAAMGTVVKPELQEHPVLGHFFLKRDFFASDPLRLFYVNIQMPTGTALEDTLAKTVSIEKIVRQHLESREVRSVVSWSGQMFTETAPLQGKHYGQILVVLKPREQDMRSIDEITDSMREEVLNTVGPIKTYFLKLSGGPPAAKAVSVKVRGDDLEQIRSSTTALKDVLQDAGWAKDISDNDTPGLAELKLNIDQDAAKRAGIDPLTIMRTVRLLVDGEVVTSIQDEGEKVAVRVVAKSQPHEDIEDVLNITLPTTNGGSIPLRQLVTASREVGLDNIRHYNFRRSITLEADIDTKKIDTITANNYLKEQWKTLRADYPGIDLSFAGQLDDLEESLQSIFRLMLFGILLMYAILGTQFRSYFQPLLVLFTVPMAFTGVVVGLLITGNPLSLYTMYGVVALAGIAVNAAIVLISAANSRLQAGMSVLHATIYAARRRVVPILITSLTTIAGLFSLAAGIGGHSLIWGPVAIAIVWGLVVSTVLTLFTIPLLYRLFMPRSYLVKQRARLELESK